MKSVGLAISAALAPLYGPRVVTHKDIGRHYGCKLVFVKSELEPVRGHVKRRELDGTLFHQMNQRRVTTLTHVARGKSYRAAEIKKNRPIIPVLPKMSDREKQIYDVLKTENEMDARQIANAAHIDTTYPAETAAKFANQLAKAGIAIKGGTRMSPTWKRAA